MTDLIISEITLMRPGFCVIGLKRDDQSFRSLRPLPPFGNAWLSFPHRRGEILSFRLAGWPAAHPHSEDHISSGVLKKVGEVTEMELVRHLRQAEAADRVQNLFGCGVHQRRQGGNVCVEPGQGTRSICGCEFSNLRLELVGDHLRAALALPSGETLQDLPVVDRDWNEFVSSAQKRIAGANSVQRLNRFLRTSLMVHVLSEPDRFARIGLSRPFNGGCWLMLDSLFPLPQQAWLEEFR